MDDDGLIPEALEEALLACRAAGERVKFLYTVPNFHNPAGVTLSEPRREAVIALAERYDLLVRAFVTVSEGGLEPPCPFGH